MSVTMGAVLQTSDRNLARFSVVLILSPVAGLLAPISFPALIGRAVANPAYSPCQTNSLSAKYSFAEHNCINGNYLTSRR